jgi:hypothetical protein
VERWKPEVVQGLALVLHLEEQQDYGQGGREGREESKSQLERVLGFFFFKWKQDYRTLSPTKGIFHLLLSD